MPRKIFPIVLVLLLTLMSLSNHALAFTVRFGPVPVSDNAGIAPETTGADLPTPRLFNIAIGANGLAFGPRSTAPETPVVTPTFKVRSQTPPRARNVTNPRQLSGVELLLLRDAHQVAKR